MPRLNISGDWCAGIGGGIVSVNGQPIAQPAGSACWMDARRVVYQNCSGGVCRVESYNVLNAEVVPILNHGANSVEGGGGLCAAWFGTFDPNQAGITTSDGRRFPSSGLGPVGPDGALALKVEYQSAGPWDVVELPMQSGEPGPRWRLTDGDAGNINLLGQGRAVWNDEHGQVHARGMIVPVLVTPTFYWLRVLELEPDVFWALYQDGIGRLVFHPFDSTWGYVVTSGNTFRPDVCHLSGIGFRVVWALSEGEPPADVRTRDIDPLTEPLVQLAEVPEPAQKPPVLTVHFYEPVLKAGVPWAVDFSNDGDGTRFVVSKDEHDQLWIEAENDAGSTATGLIRQLTVEGPDVTPEPEPEPEPPPMHSQSRFWLHPNIGSKDLLDVFDDMSLLANVDVFGLYVQEILTDVSNPQLGTNIWPNLVAHDVVRKLAQAGIPLAIELGAVKPGDCLAQGNISGMQTALQRVHDAGGVVGYLTMDEPLYANQQACGGNIGQCADAVAAFIHSVHAIDDTIKVGLAEPWPAVTLDHLEQFLSDLLDRSAPPDYLEPDINWHDAETFHHDPIAFIHACQQLCHQYGMVLHLLDNATKDPIPTDAEHFTNLQALATKLHGIDPTAACIVTQSWATRDGTVATQNVPNNLGAAGLLASLAVTRSTFETVTPPQPEPEIDPMLYATPIDRVLVLKQPPKPIADTRGLHTLILADPADQVFAQIPDSSDGTRPPGDESQYTQCRLAGSNGAVFNPTDGHGNPKYFLRSYVVATNL